MNNRETMQALLAGRQPEVTPQWLMGASAELAGKLLGEDSIYEGYGEYPMDGAYPFGPMGEDLLARAVAFNDRIGRPALPIGWGANAAFGHAGPGEFNKTVIEKDDRRMIVQYETGAKREIRFSPHNVHIFDLPVKTPADLHKLTLPDVDEPARYEGFAADVAAAKAAGQWTIGWINGFFSAGHYFAMEYAEFLMNLMAESEFAKALIARMGEWTLKAAEHMCDAGVDCIGTCDDLGSQQAMLISPDMYRELILPWHRRLCDLVHSHGAVVHLHSHGAILPILRDIADAGVDILNPLDPDDSMPIAEVRHAVGDKVVLCGGMNKHFFDWDRDTQVAHLRQVVAMGRELGPHILMDSGGLPDSIEADWFAWFLETSAELRRE